MTPYERVKLSRERTAATFPLPSPVDCIRYAICELAEYDDALLRLERAGDKRNNDRQHDPAAELGQALYMLLSAAVQWDLQPKPHGEWLRLITKRPEIFGYTLRQMSWLLEEHHELTFNAAYAGACGLIDWHGWDVDALIDATCNDFERKHAEVTA